MGVEAAVNGKVEGGDDGGASWGPAGRIPIKPSRPRADNAHGGTAASSAASFPREGYGVLITTTKGYQFSLVKGADRYLVRCDVGKEEETIGRLIQWAENEELDFDWFDAAVLSRQITQRQFGRAAGETPEP